jgi:hypothetical protein
MGYVPSMMTQATESRPKVATAPQVVAGVVVAGLSLVGSGLATVLYASDDMRLLGLVLGALLVTGATVLAARLPVVGLASGAFLVLAMVALAATGSANAVFGNRPELSFGSIIALGGTGLLSAALVASFVATGLIMADRTRMSERAARG